MCDAALADEASEGIENLAADDEQCFAYYKPYCIESFEKAMADLERYIATDGPFDGIMAFSQGASLAAAILADKNQLQRLRLRCGIFLCGRLPFTDAGYRYPHTTISPQDMELRIGIPTAHIWGAEDKQEPGQGLALSELCRPEWRHTYIHGGGHEVPGARDKDDLAESANVIRRMLAQL